MFSFLARNRFLCDCSFDENRINWIDLAKNTFVRQITPCRIQPSGLLFKSSPLVLKYNLDNFLISDQLISSELGKVFLQSSEISTSFKLTICWPSLGSQIDSHTYLYSSSIQSLIYWQYKNSCETGCLIWSAILTTCVECWASCW